MTNKDYKAIAWAISNAKYSFGDDIGSDQIEVLERVTLYIADTLEAQNPRFFRTTFLAMAFSDPHSETWHDYESMLKKQDSVDGLDVDI